MIAAFYSDTFRQFIPRPSSNLKNTTWVEIVHMIKRDADQAAVRDMVMACFRELRSRKEWSTLSVDTFVANEANAGQARTVTVAAVEGLVRVWWHSVAVLLPMLFVLKGCPACVFKWGDNMVGGDTLSVKVLNSRCDMHKGIFHTQSRLKVPATGAFCWNALYS